VNAHRIKPGCHSGHSQTRSWSDFYFVEAEDPEGLQDLSSRACEDPHSPPLGSTRSAISGSLPHEPEVASAPAYITSSFRAALNPSGRPHGREVRRTLAAGDKVCRSRTIKDRGLQRRHRVRKDCRPRRGRTTQVSMADRSPTALANSIRCAGLAATIHKRARVEERTRPSCDPGHDASHYTDVVAARNCSNRRPLAASALSSWLGQKKAVAYALAVSGRRRWFEAREWLRRLLLPRYQDD